MGDQDWLSFGFVRRREWQILGEDSQRRELFEKKKNKKETSQS